VALAWQPLSTWLGDQPWPVLAAAAIGTLLMIWN